MWVKVECGLAIDLSKVARLFVYQVPHKWHVCVELDSGKTCSLREFKDEPSAVKFMEYLVKMLIGGEESEKSSIKEAQTVEYLQIGRARIAADEVKNICAMEITELKAASCVWLVMNNGEWESRLAGVFETRGEAARFIEMTVKSYGLELELTLDGAARE